MGRREQRRSGVRRRGGEGAVNRARESRDKPEGRVRRGAVRQRGVREL